MHQQGYKYTGPGNLYDVTFFEIDSLTEGQRFMEFASDGVTTGEERMLNEISERLAE